MAAVFSLLTALVSLALAAQVGRQFWQRRRPHQAIWMVALLLFAVGAGCQVVAAQLGWSPTLYRLWYLSGAILTAAYLGQGTVYLLARRPVAHAVTTILLAGSVVAAVMVLRAPVDLRLALAGGMVSGYGMPRAVRVMTPFFNIFGTVALVGGAAQSVGAYLWNGGNGRRALGTALIAVGTLVVAAGGTLARFGTPADLYLAELLGIVVIFSGFTATAQADRARTLSMERLAQRRRRVTRLGVGLGAGTLLSMVLALPLLPWGMGILTDMKHVYINAVPADNRGAYLVTQQGVMQLYSWYVEPDDFPSDAPTLDAASVHSIAVVQKQFDTPDKYQLYDVTTNQRVAWQAVRTAGMQMTLDVTALAPGEYMLVVPTDSMFGGQTWHYVHLR